MNLDSKLAHELRLKPLVRIAQGKLAHPGITAAAAANELKRRGLELTEAGWVWKDQQ